MTTSVDVTAGLDRERALTVPAGKSVPVQTTGKHYLRLETSADRLKHIDRGENHMFIARRQHESTSKLTRCWKWLGVTLLLIPLPWTTGCGSTPLPVGIQITPGTSSLTVGQAQAFSATVINTSRKEVTWSVQEGSAGGTISASGVYTAPMKAGSYHIIAQSVADSTKMATATITATAPSPAFTSSAPTAAAEGVAYTYTLSATDPVNTGIKFSVTSGPTGASITNNTLMWTPTHGQSRVANSFDILAMTGAGGTASQKFTVTPLGTIRGTAIDTYLTATGNQTVPEDLSQAYIGVSFQNGSSWTTVQGVGNSDGTFAVTGVPAGSYWLAISSGGYWTSTSDIDLGQDFLGRPDTVPASNGTSLSLSMTGMDPWTINNVLDIYNPNLRQDFDWSENINALDTSFDSVWNWTGPLSNADKGDAWYVTQEESTTVSGTTWNYVAKASPAISMTQSDANLTPLTGTLGSPSQLSVHMGESGTQFASAASSLGSDATVHSTMIGVYSQPFSSAKGAVGLVEDLLEAADQSPMLQDADFGDISFGNPFPQSWTPFVSLTYEIHKPFTAAGATNAVAVPAELYLSTTQLPAKGSPLVPAITPVLKLKLNGAALTQGGSTNTLTPTLAWDPPSTGTPTGYRITIYQLAAVGSDSGYQPVLDLFTKDHTMVIPEGILQSGNEYFFGIRAYLIPSVDLTVAPYHGAFPWSHADMLTPVVSTAGATGGVSGTGPVALAEMLRARTGLAPRAGSVRIQGQRTTSKMVSSKVPPAEPGAF
jgi:hypothetical protein